MSKYSKIKMIFLLSTFLLLIYTWGIDIVLGAEFLQSWSDFHYVMLINVLKFVVGLGALWILWHYGNREVFQFRFKWSYVGYFFLLLIAHLAWSIFTFLYFPKTMNQVAINSNYVLSDQITLYVEMFGLIVISPFVEEMIFRGVLMEAFSPWKKVYIDVLASSALFSVIHVMYDGWVLTDFIYYFVPGILIALYFRKTNCIYYVLVYHVFWNSLPEIIRLFR